MSAAANDNNRIHQRVQNIFREVFGDQQLTICDATTAADIPQWGSLTHINLILALEEEFQFEFSSEEVTSMTCVGDLLTVIEKRQ